MRKLTILLLGGLIITLLSYFCFLDKAQRIQNKLVANVQKSYDSNDMNWVKTNKIDSKFGPTRNIKLTGTAPSNELKYKAQKLALMQNGVHNVDNQLVVKNMARSEQKQPPKNDSHAKDNSTTTKITQKDETNTSDKKIVLKDDEATSVYPYTINVQKDRDSKVTINGLVPDSKTHNEIISYAKDLYGSSNIIDELREANGAPDMWASNIKTGLDELKDTTYGKFDINQFKYNFKAYVDDLDTKNSLLKEYESTPHSGVLASFDISSIKKQSVLDRMLDKAEMILAKAEQKAKDSLKEIHFGGKDENNISKKSINKVAFSCQDELTKILSQNKIHFQYNKAKIDSTSYPLLDSLSNTMKKCPENKAITISGHTDSTGSAKYNLTLSTNRAKEVKEYMLKKGISKEKLVAIGYGETKPIANNSTKDGRAKNRRIELNVVDVKDIPNIKVKSHINIVSKEIKKDKKVVPLADDKAFRYCQKQIRYLTSKEKIHFSIDKKSIAKKSYKFMDALSKVVSNCPHTKITIEAHTDSIGDEDENKKLSLIKANTVKSYMVKKGVNKDQLKTIGYGESKPLADNSSPAGRSKNRRVEFKVGGSK